MTIRGTILTSASGRALDLLAPTPDMIDWEDVAEHLAKEKRFNGATPGVEYSVAQHVCLGADAILADRDDELLAAYFLLHDVPEYALKDDTTPKKRALAELAQQKFGILADQIMATFDDLTERWDRAVHEKAGIAWPMPREVARLIKRYDQLMIITEWRDLMPGDPPFDVGGLESIPGLIEPWPWHHARREFLARAKRLLPALKG